MRNVSGYSHLFKTKTGAVINTDPAAKIRIAKRRAEEDRLNNMEDKLNRIENLLERLINKDG